MPVCFEIPEAMRARMEYLEAIDQEDRVNGTSRMKRLRQVPAETGKYLAGLAATAPAGGWIEIGTSAGYSAMWLALACRSVGAKLTTFEVLDEKAALAADTIRLAKIDDVVKLVHGDAREHVAHLDDIAFCFLDAEKEVYADCYEIVVPKLVPGGLLVADNAISHQADLQPFLDRVEADERVDSSVVSIGKGELVCRKIG
jgi:caffeoyl-CoA O-methyltransferase